MSLLQFNVLTGECCACKNEELKSTHLYHTNYFHPLYDINNEYMGFTTVDGVCSLERISKELSDFGKE